MSFPAEHPLVVVVVMFVVFVDEFGATYDFLILSTERQPDKRNDTVVYRVAPQLKCTNL